MGARRPFAEVKALDLDGYYPFHATRVDVLRPLGQRGGGRAFDAGWRW